MRFLIVFASLLYCCYCYSQKYSSNIFSVSNPAKTYVAILANEDYQLSSEKYTPNVTHAILEGESFKQRLIKDYGISKHNITFYENANATQIKLSITKIAKLAQKNSNKSELIIFYTGKYVDHNNELFLLPPGTSEDELKYAVGLEYIYKKLELSDAQKITILIDGEPLNRSRKASLLTNGGMQVEVSSNTLYKNTKVSIALWEQTVLYANAEQNNIDSILTKNNSEAHIIDKENPALKISSHKTDTPIQTSENSVLIKGKAFDNIGLFIVSINGQEAHLHEDGQFNARVSLQPGRNNIIVQAIDVNKNITKKTITIDKSFEEVNKAIYESSNRSLHEPETISDGSYYALLIGVNDYQDPSMTNLDGPLQDVTSLNTILTDYYVFNEEKVFILKNPTRQEIIQKFDELEQKITDTDNLLIFFAGHGTWNERVKKGYWLPADAQLNNTANWIRNSTISGYISGIQSKHTLLIADACFSGGIFKTRSIQESPESIQKIYQLPSRKAMTSGTLKEVPDRSVFIEFFTKRLEENTEKYISAEQLFYSFKPAVLNNSDNIPQYGVVKNAGDEGGDFIFIRK